MGDRECINCGLCMDACNRGAISIKAGSFTLKAPERGSRSEGTGTQTKRRRVVRAIWGVALALLASALIWFNLPESGNQSGQQTAAETVTVIPAAEDETAAEETAAEEPASEETTAVGAAAPETEAPAADTTEGSGTPAAASGSYTPGTYTATAKGIESDVKVDVTVDESSITDVAIDVSGETAGIGADIGDQMAEAILEAQSADVDAVAGRNALEMVLAVYKSQLTGKPVKLPLKDFASVELTGLFGEGCL